MTAKKNVKKPHLGRGLESLLGPMTVPEQEQPQVSEESSQQVSSSGPSQDRPTELALKQIIPNPYQPRKNWNAEELDELASSIRANGIIQPIIVRKTSQDSDLYEIIAGERRFRAAGMVGLGQVPVVIRNATDEQMLELALVENIHRANLNPVERALAYQNYVESFSITQTEAAERLGENRSVIANHIRLLDLPQEIKQYLIEGQLSMGHARALLALPSDELRNKLAHKALANRLNVREVEKLVKKQLENKDEIKEKPEKEPYIVDLQKRISEALGTKVQINPNKKGNRGRIVIDYYSIDDFERLTEKMGLTKYEDM